MELLGAGFELGVLPGLGQPAVHKVVEHLGVVLDLQELPDHLLKRREGRIQGIHPEGHAPGGLAVPADKLPSPGPQHGGLIPVGEDAAALLADVPRPPGPLDHVRLFLLAGPFQLGKFQLDVGPAVGAGHEIVLLGLGGLLGPPDQPRFQGGGAGHEDLPVQPVALGALDRQGYGVGFLLGGAGVLVHLIQEQIPDGGGGQVCRAVGAGEVDGHPVKPLGQILALVGPVFGRQRRAALEHGLQLGLHRPLGQLVGGIHHHGGARVLVDGAVVSSEKASMISIR